MTAESSGAGHHASFTSAELRQRVLWGVVLAVSALAVTVVGGWLMTVGVAIMAVVVAREWTRIAVRKDLEAVAALAVPVALAVLIAGTGQVWIALGIAAVASVGVGIWFRSGWAATGVVYASSLGVALVALRGDSLGLEAVIFVLVVVWATDSAAFFTGRRIGGPKLWPAVSPKKTWSGAIGGLVAAVLAGILTGWASGVTVTLALAGVALLLSVISQAGDLFESALKRRFGTKDASSLIPGHGGLMDRVDGLTFAAAAAALVGWIHLGWPELGRGLLVW